MGLFVNVATLILICQAAYVGLSSCSIDPCSPSTGVRGFEGEAG